MGSRWWRHLRYLLLRHLSHLLRDLLRRRHRNLLLLGWHRDLLRWWRHLLRDLLLGRRHRLILRWCRCRLIFSNWLWLLLRRWQWLICESDWRLMLLYRLLTFNGLLLNRRQRLVLLWDHLRRP